jgi:hypothetical protein
METRKALLIEKGFPGGCSIHIMGGDIVKLLLKQYNKENTMSTVKTFFSRSIYEGNYQAVYRRLTGKKDYIC